MKPTSETSTTRMQRIMLWLVALLMLVGTIGSFVVIVIANDNDQKEQARYTQLLAEYQAKQDAQTEALSTTYKDTLAGYQSRVSAFSADGISEVRTEDLLVGDGEELSENSSFSAYYIGWNPSGVIFDQSISDDGTLSSPLSVSPGAVIDGWTEGVVGMKVGGVRELTIPSDKAYGETGQGDDIPPNTPLKFVVMVIPEPETLTPSDELIRLYQRYGASS